MFDNENFSDLQSEVNQWVYEKEDECDIKIVQIFQQFDPGELWSNDYDIF